MSIIQKLKNIYFYYWKKRGCFGDYSDWQAAVNDCTGYDEDGIFDKVKQATLKVKNGEARYERDSVLFYDESINENLIQRLKLVQNTEGGKLSVLDFGGALGSLYFQHKNILSDIPNMKWCVVEQGHFVEFGKKELEDKILKFEYDIHSAIDLYQPNFILISSVLQYLEQPYSILNALLDAQIPYVFIDRTPLMPIEKDRIVKQIVPAYIYKASYPAWIFSKAGFNAYLKKKAEIIDNFINTDKNNIDACTYEGFFLRIKK